MTQSDTGKVDLSVSLPRRTCIRIFIFGHQGLVLLRLPALARNARAR